MYQPYLDLEEFYRLKPDSLIPTKDVKKQLIKTSRHIDTLTFNRINIKKLTAFQNGILREVTAELAEFEYENKEVLQTMLSSYAINGVSMNFGKSWNVKIIKGVAIPYDLYDTLAQTGLCARTFYY